VYITIIYFFFFKDKNKIEIIIKIKGSNFIAHTMYGRGLILIVYFMNADLGLTGIIRCGVSSDGKVWLQCVSD
jgi:hypothetical protein